ncbi:MAG: ribosomal protein S18-alanine N-acetyltransferase [Burkholderiales bacterium]|nr:ribosomal protein S18-alanine N-acetyltransferase [Pseudomonadota bacterium]
MSAEPKSLLQYGPMVLTDLKLVIEIENQVYSHPWNLGNFRDSILAGHRCVMLTYGETLIGYAVLMVAADEVHLLNLTIAAQWQRKGYGHALLLHLVAMAVIEFAHSFFLEVRASNAAAQALYSSLGFNTIGVRRNYYPAHAGREDAIVMELKL